MVHALLECWRVLGREGRLIDIRPVHTNPAVEVITDDGRFTAGYLIDESEQVDDIAADQAIDEVIRRGCFSVELRDNFNSASYWDSLDDLQAYADKKWRSTKQLAPEVVEQARLLIASSGGRYRLCIRRKIQISVYCKQADFTS